MIIYKPFLEATKNYTQLQLKFVFSILKKDGTNGVNEFDKKELKQIFWSYKNVPDIAKKLVEGIKTNERKNGNQLFDSIDYLYPCYIGYDLNEKIKKSIDYITFSNSIISQFPNSGNSLRLFLLLLFGFEKNNDTCKFTTTELQTELFMNKKAYRTDTTTNASANQFAKIKQALDVINQIPDYNIDVIPIKTGRTITSFMFENKKQTIYVRTASEELIKKLEEYGN